MLVKHVRLNDFPVHITTAAGTYCIQEIQRKLTPIQLKYLTTVAAFTGNDTVSNIYNHGNCAIFNKLCADGSMFKHMDVLNSPDSTSEEICKAGIAIFQFIYNAPHTDLHLTRFHMYSQSAKNGVIKPELLPPTKGCAIQHSLRSYLQNQDWIELKSMSRNPKKYGFKIGKNGYEPITTLDEWAPEHIKKLISCKCKTPCDTNRCSCKKAGVKCISACGVCKGVDCKNINDL